MSFRIWMGLHGVAAEDYASAGEAHRGYQELKARGGEYLQIMEGSREISFDELAARAEAEAKDAAT